ncbi:MAG: IS4 family transposase [Nevskia sp.]|nr:IS4 family transposase [Nevskia sp.]
MSPSQLGQFGDRRRAAVGDALLTAMQKQQTMCLHALAEDRAEMRQFNDFLDNPAVTRHEMLAHAGRLAARRAAGRHVLAIADTSELNFARHTASKRGFGTVGNGRDLGVFLHPIIAVDAAHGGILGLVGAEVMNRTNGKVADRKTREADEKESRRWLTGAQTAGERLAEAATITMVEDREGDIYDQFARCPANVHLLVRAARNRSVGAHQRLFEPCPTWSEAARYTIQVPARRGKTGKGLRAERTALVAVRFGEVTLRRPACADKDLAETLTLRVVDVREVDPPADPKDRVHWCLLTTHAVDTPEQALRILGWYRLRWTIEQVFRTMKTDGVDVETSQITTVASLLKLVTVALIAAIRVMQLVIGRDGSTSQPITDVIADPDELPALRAINASREGRTEKLKNPFDPASLAWFAWIAARLGGWSGYTSKGYKPPGPKTMARGLRQLEPMVKGWIMANRSALPGLP